MAEGKCFHLEVVTPDRQFYIGDADSLVLPAIDGYMGVEAAACMGRWSPPWSPAS